MKSSDGKSQREVRRVEERRSEKRKNQKLEDIGVQKGRKVTKHCAGAEPSGQMRDEKLHTVVARSTFRSQNVQNTPGPDHFWQVEMSKKCMPLWREAHFEVKMYKTHHVRTTFGRSELVSRGRRQGVCTFSKVSKM